VPEGYGERRGARSGKPASDVVSQGRPAALQGLRLRLAQDADSDRIIALVAASWKEIPGKILVLGRDAPDLWTPATEYAEAGGGFWLVEQGARLVATIALMPSAVPGMVELRRFYIARGWRGTGLGAALLRLFDAEAARRGAEEIELWTDTRMLAAQQIYKRCGYARGPERRIEIETGTVRYRYTKRVPPSAGDAADSKPIWNVAPHLPQAAERVAGPRQERRVPAVS
jgi:putative acetyltransferase